MTTTTKNETRKATGAKNKPVAKTARAPKPKGKATKAKKPLRIREELLPDSATYVTMFDREYIAIPVEDFGDWYEDTVDDAVAEDRKFTDGPPIPFEKAAAEIRSRRSE